jgi:hypothetical protein
LAEERKEPARVHTVVLTPIIVDTAPNLNRTLAVVGFLTLAFMTSPKLELLEMFYELL